ncbi:unnamed protein product [Lactuca virosa]|uniref:Uncharacterized protein n=1 Tax=Lactuca virosa TaxID=75947 RepID=A0AAU9NYL4_9ASTR|nr:unnamed protein product [Lactuca virosa]
MLTYHNFLVDHNIFDQVLSFVSRVDLPKNGCFHETRFPGSRERVGKDNRTKLENMAKLSGGFGIRG